MSVAAITAAMVKELRETTGVGMMDCKRALVETDGDVERAQQWLRERGLARAASKSGRSTNEGIIESYLHATGGIARVGVLLELACESDFVAKTDDFRALARELALQIAGGAPEYVRREDVPAAVVDRERAIARKQVEGKPGNIVEKIVSGKLDAFFAETCLLEQVWIKDEHKKKTVAMLVAEAVARLGENITVPRFARYVVGESTASSHPAPENGERAENGATAPSGS
jgi:elongation factor Ts